MDAQRLARAVHLTAERVAPGRYVVRGGRAPHEVTVDGDRLVCECADAAYRPGVECAHRLAVRLRRGDPVALAGLRELVAWPVRRPRRKVRAHG